MKIAWAIASAFILMFADLSFAAESTAQPERAETPEQFTKMSRDIETQMEPGGRYEYMKKTDKTLVTDGLAQMVELIQSTGSVSALTDANKVRLFNLQERVNGLLTNNASDRLICKHDAPIGSHIPVTTCRTYAETVHTTRDTQKWIQDNLMKVWTIGPGK